MKDSMIIEKILSSKPIFINEYKIDCKIAIPKDYISEGKPGQKVPQFNSENETTKSKIFFEFYFVIKTHKKNNYFNSFNFYSF